MANNSQIDNVKLVMNGFTNLSPLEKQEFIDLLNKYLKSYGNDKMILESTFSKTAASMSTGPLSNNICKCCGR